MPAQDYFGAPERFDAPAYRAVAVTPNDGADLTVVTRGLYVGTGGNLVVVMAGGGNTVVFTAVPSGTILPVAVSRVNATSTTASAIVAIW